MTLDYQEIVEHLLRLANKQTAEQTRRFFKTGIGEYSHDDIFLGIPVPVLRKAVRRFKEADLTISGRLLLSENHEFRQFALFLLTAQFKTGNVAQQAAIYQLYFNRIERVNNWDLVDASAYQIVGEHLVDKDRRILHELAVAESMWQRRIAIVATYAFIKRDQFQDTLWIAENLLKDKEDLIHKASGWMLRELAKRNQTIACRFLDQHTAAMPRTMLRYTIEKFPEQLRQYYLQK